MRMYSVLWAARTLLKGARRIIVLPKLPTTGGLGRSLVETIGSLENSPNVA